MLGYPGLLKTLSKIKGIELFFMNEMACQAMFFALHALNMFKLANINRVLTGGLDQSYPNHD
jgi:hypothetical protein